jgi:hypothetical protein
MNQEHIEQYLAGRLSESDAQAFEEYCVANPDFARQVEFEQRLKAGLTEVSRGSTAEFVRSNNPGRWQLAAAAAGIVFSLLTAFVLWRQYNPRNAPSILGSVITDSQRNGAHLRLALVRGSDTTPELQPGLVRVEIAGLFEPGSEYLVDLDRIDPKKDIRSVASLYGVHPSSPVALEVMVDSDQLEPGAYSLRVRKQAASDEPLDFEFLKH